MRSDMRYFRVRNALLVIVPAIVAGLIGLYVGHYNSWPIAQIIAWERKDWPIKSRAPEEYAAYAYHPGKQKVDCPAPTSKTLVLFLSGQSNAANESGQRYTSDYGDRILNFYNGNCYLAQSPLLGSSENEGESWTLLANKLLARGLADRVILVPVAVGGSSLARWIEQRDLKPVLLDAVTQVQRRYRITEMLWVQGEADYLYQTPRAKYVSEFQSMARSLRGVGMTAPIFITIETRCPTPRPWSAKNEISDAQRSLIDPSHGIFLGVDTDALMGPLDRFDDCHFDGTGQEKFAERWADILQDYVGKKQAL
jgi:hypothetical protein